MTVGPLVAVGMDVGGTATRVLVVDTSGRRRGSSQAGGANPVAHQQRVWANAVNRALSRALLEAGPVTVGSVVAGVAGALAGHDVAAAFERIIRSHAGRSCPVQLTGDVVIAFAAGTAEPDGTILIAGTGAAAAAIRDRRPVREVDGHGWLLGDAGSGFWIGREAVRAVLAELDGRGPVTRLRPLIVKALLGQDPAETEPRSTCNELVRAAHARPPGSLSRLAPIVSRCANQGDQVALGIARGAAGHLLSAVQVVRSPRETTPIVVTGGVAAGDHLPALLLRQGLEARWPGCVRAVRNGVAGAAWLALRALPETDQGKMDDLHHNVVHSAGS